MMSVDQWEGAGKGQGRVPERASCAWDRQRAGQLGVYGERGVRGLSEPDRRVGCRAVARKAAPAVLSAVGSLWFDRPRRDVEPSCMQDWTLV